MHKMTTQQVKAPVFPDPYLLVTASILVAFGLVMVYSTTGIGAQERFGDSLMFLKRQGFAAVVGFVCLYLATRIDIERLHRNSAWFLVAAVALLALPVLSGLGDEAGGARRWVGIVGVRFQPGEIAKLAFVIFMAGYFARHESGLARFGRGIITPFLLLAPIAALFLMQPDFGSVAVLTAVTICMAAVAGVRLRYIALGAVLVAGCFAVLVAVSPYRMSRIMSFLSPWQDASGKGYQLIQSLIAIGTGEIGGVGLGGSQQKLYFLPAAHTDFIFAVIAEELGFVGALVMMSLFVVILWRGLLIAGKLADDTFCFALSVGLTMLIVLPAMLNIGVVTGLLPTKGMVLPLVGYGGTNLVVSLTVVGLLLALARHLRARRT
ncbi:MAG: putative lipid II flippase FtsW [Proteobacteria bacterium]|nr:MAG: putative lipid II flippase FtsW [Pseudomonadota bacterium]